VYVAALNPEIISIRPLTTCELTMRFGSTPAYILDLQKQAAAQAPPAKAPSLRERFLDWYGSLPAFTRDRAFAMSEFEAALKTQGKYISPVLLELGWTRHRIWNTTGQYHRYWQPPVRSD
jgi:hypothetical protein